MTTPPPENGPVERPLIERAQFEAVELKIGKVIECAPHPDADRLLVMKVDLGEPTLRQIVAGIRADWQPSEIVGKSLIICANLKPAKLRGVESQGMMLAVRGDTRVWPLTIEGDAVPGTRVT
jgi:methionyl-tRNA synthetase